MEKINKSIIVCNYAKYTGTYTHKINLWGKDKINVYPRVTVFKKFFGELNPRLVDFIEIATYIYVADQMIVRSQKIIDPHGYKWRRNIKLIIAVQDIDFWVNPQVVKCLEDLLRFLGDDKYEFEFVKLTETHPEQTYFNFNDKMGNKDAPEQVMLFSGGLDSLGGAINELIVNGKRTVLVRHKSSPKHKGRYQKLEDELQKRSGNKATFFTINTGKDKILGKEYTQRSRSFLYFALGSTIAHLLGLNSVHFYENGPISINLPMSNQVIGGRATRTTHPKTLFYFQKLIRFITDNDNFLIENKFIDKTKSEIVNFIKDNQCGDLIVSSISCAHAWQQTTDKNSHCGVCSQCIDRRVAIIASDSIELDKNNDYLIDFFVEAVDEEFDEFDAPNKNLLTSFFLKGRQIGNPNYTYEDFEFDYPMLNNAAIYMKQSANIAANNIFKLYKRLANDIEKVETYVLSNPQYLKMARDLDNPISPDSLYGILSRGVRKIVERKEVKIMPVSEYIFKKNGDFWELRYNGGYVNKIKHYNGCDYLVELLSNPNRIFELNELDLPSMLNAVTVDGSEMIDGYGDTNNYIEAIDEKTKKDCYVALEKAKSDKEKAIAENNTVEASTHEEIINKLEEYLGKNIKKGGKARNLNKDLKRKIDKIRRAISTLRNKIEVYDKPLAEHLKNTISIGEKGLIYKPDTHIDWQIK